MNDIGVGLIGSGFMGRCHAIAFREVASVFDLPAPPRLEIVADVDEATAARAARAFGFARATGNWRDLLGDPAVDVIDITAPNTLHKPIALAAIAAGKHVYCEKPLAQTAADAAEMVQAAEAAGVRTLVGFNYLKNPVIALAREIVQSGEIGTLTAFRGEHSEDYMSDPAAPFTWRLDPEGGPGVVADLGSHIVSMARHLVGPITAVCAEVQTVVPERPSGPGSSARRPVTVPDQMQCLARFADGTSGILAASWVATGRKMQQAWEITGTKGTLAYNGERMNELQLYAAGQPAGREGFKTILAGPQHPPFGNFVVAPGHQLGFNDMKVIEVRDLLLGVVGTALCWPDFREAWEVQRVVDAIMRSVEARRWVGIDEI